jgi:hypothetical protein
MTIVELRRICKEQLRKFDQMLDSKPVLAALLSLSTKIQSGRKKIVFSRREGAISTRLHIMDSDGTNVVALPGSGSNSSPEWR